MKYIFISLILFFILQSRECALLAYEGARLCFTRMVPSLFPFMLLSNIMIQLQIPQKLFQNNRTYCEFIGYTFGFPLGAKSSAALYENGDLCKEEAQYLLNTCNLIGPSYVLGYALPIFKIENKLPYIIGLFFIPFLYGKIVYLMKKSKMKPIEGKMKSKIKTNIRTNSLHSFSIALSKAIENSIWSLANLCSYVILCRVLIRIPVILLPELYRYLCPLVEINSGIQLLAEIMQTQSNNKFIIIYAMGCLCFGGLSCVLQTISAICDTDLSIRQYVLHKICLSIIVVLYFGIISYLGVF